MTTAASETTVMFPAPMNTQEHALAKVAELGQTLEERELGGPSSRQLAAIWSGTSP